MAEPKKQLRTLQAPFVAPGPSGVALRDRLKHLTTEDEKVLRLVGAHLGALASRDLKARCADGLEHSSQTWAARKQGLTAASSSRWAGSITKATHDQWALSRRCQLAHIQNLEAGVHTLTHRLSQPIGEKGTTKAPGGYRSKNEWFHKSRRLATLESRLEQERSAREDGRVRVVRGGRKLMNTRHHLADAQLTEAGWRKRWEAARWSLAADGESGKRFGNETIRVTPDGEVSVKLPAPLAHLANAPHGRYVLTAKVRFKHRGEEWADRIEGNRAVAYRIHYDAARDRWYLTASWQRPVVQTVPLPTARANGMIGVDTNADHFAAYRLDRPRQPGRRAPAVLLRPHRHRRPPGRTGPARPHPAFALGQALRCDRPRYRGPGLRAGEDPRETRPAQKIPAPHLRHADRQAQSPAGVDGRRAGPRDRRGRSGVYVGVGRCALAQAPDQQHSQDVPSRCGEHRDRATRPRAPDPATAAPPHDDQSDRCGHRTVQAGLGVRGREGTRRPVTERARDARRRTGTDQRTRGTSASKTVRDARSARTWVQDSLLLTD